MTKFAYRAHRILQAVFTAVGLFALANFYLDLGFFGRGAKGVLLSVMGVFVIYAAYFVPTRQDVHEHSRRKASEDR
jgi:hypothetical protein